MNVDDLRPWGLMEETVLQKIANRPIPEAWQPLQGRDREEEWKEWLAQLGDDLDDLIWPTFDTAAMAWTRRPDEHLIRADLDLMWNLFAALQQRIRPPRRTEDEKTIPTHLDMFLEEDDVNIIFGHKYERYDATFPAWLTANMTDLLWNGCDRKLGSLQHQLKARFQRPRAYQVAFHLERPFRNHWGRLGNTPSLISGHCIQGVMGGCSVFLMCATSVDVVSLGILKQLTVDIGDRRVFAGVHYPSDNLSSWYTAFKLLPHVVDPSVLESVRRFLWEAISAKSQVFKAIQKHVDDARNSGKEPSPYERIVEALKIVAGC